MQTTSTTKLSAWDRIMMAITFAEANEPGTAQEILRRRPTDRPSLRSKRQARRPDLRV